MIKKSILVLFICLSATAKDIILWDLHKVVLNRSLGNTLKAIATRNTPASVANLDWQQFKQFLALTLDHCVHTKSSEDYIQIARQHNNQPFINLMVTIANAQTIMPGMPELIQELDDLGIEQQIGSNIGRTSFDQLVKQPEFAALFEHMNIKKSQVVEANPERIIKKPDPLFFKRYLEKNNYDPRKMRIIFIDDKKENIDIANIVGLIGIHFRDINQLRHELIKLGISVTPPTQKQVRFEGYKHLFK